MRRHRVDDGSFRERVEDLVPLLGTERSPMNKIRVETPTAVAGLRGSAAYRINQYLFDRSPR